ncbi:phasin family protein [Aurantiacibacter atlanticus]|nr:phasin family protein [Aurantiacibacter atlanticus]
MAESKNASPDKSADTAEKAYADASAETPAKDKNLDASLKADAAEISSAKTQAAPATKSAPIKMPVAKTAPEVVPAAEVAPATAKTPVKKSAPKKTTAKKLPAKKAVTKKAVTKKAPVKKVSAPKNAVAEKSATKPVAKAAAAKPVPSVTQLKEMIMATKNTDYTAAVTDTMNGAVKELQERAQSAYEKSTSAMTEANEFAKGNVEAVVESGKLFAEGVQTLGQSYADEAKSAYETVTTDLKEMASVTSPTDLFQLQGKILRRNFDAMIAVTSKNTDAAMKMTNDVMAPISGRMNVAAEKLSKVA